MNIDLRSAAIGLALGLAAWAGWYAGSTRPVIQRLVEEKAQVVSRANQLEQDNAKMKEIAEHWFTVANSQTQPAPDPGVAMLNAVRPGLGTVAASIGKTMQKQQQPVIAYQSPAPAANSCSAGMQWNGLKCVCSPPTVPVTMNDGSVACFPAEVAK